MTSTENAAPLYEGVLVMLVDGARPDVMRQMAEAGEMPMFKRHFVDARGFRDATSVFPTVSGPAHLPVLTGAHPGRANLPGIRWAERPTRPRAGFLGRTRSYMAPFRARKLARDIPPGISTLFSHVPGMADVNTWFVRGCPGHARLTRFSKITAFLRSFATKDWYSSDLQAESAVLRAFSMGFTSAFGVFPAVDELGHRFGPMTEESFEAYRRFDKVLGRIVEGLHKFGRLEKTLLVITSDHGQTGTTTHVDLDPLVETIYPRTVCYPKFWRHAFNADAAIMVSGNAMANIYLRGESGWAERPAFDAHGSAAQTLLTALTDHRAIDLVIYRGQSQSQGNDEYVVVNAKGSRVIKVEREQDGEGAGSVPRQITTHVRGTDPFGYESFPAVADRATCLAASASSAYPDAPWQIAEFFRSPRAGDLVVCAKPGFDLRSRFEYQPHKGSHGALNREHMMVPAAINAQWSSAGTARSVDLFPSILQALGRSVPSALDGSAQQLVRP